MFFLVQACGFLSDCVLNNLVKKLALAIFFKQCFEYLRKAVNKTQVLLLSAQEISGEKICREIRDNLIKQYYVVGFLDDDTAKLGQKIHGISVIGKIEDLEYVIKSTGATEIIIAISSTGSERMKQIVDICKKSEISFKTVPNMGELINGRLTVNSIRNVEYRDLLGRKPVVLDKEKIGEYLGEKICFGDRSRGGDWKRLVLADM